MKKKRAKKLGKLAITAIVFASVIGLFLLSVLALQIGHWVSDGIESWHPDYDMLDQSEMMEILNKSELSNEDYDVLFAQTGLSKVGIDRALANGKAGKERVLAIQKDYFTEYNIVNETFAPWFCTDYIEDHKRITNIYLENGDVLVTSSTHFSSCRIGHAGLVTDAAFGYVLQANSYSSPSKIGSITNFTDRVNFMILRPKEEYASAELRQQVVDYAKNHLVGIPYDATCGVLTDKYSITATQCAHVVWYAYNYFGIDLDANGGLVVSPWNLANSEKLEIVQIYGFDPAVGWDKLNY